MNKYNKNDIITGTITGITKYGIFFQIDEEYTGMVHISEISNKFTPNIEVLFEVGQKVDLKILEINEDKKQINLSIKRLKNKRTKRKEPRIKEEGLGFKPLEEKMKIWIEEKLKEYKE